MMALERLGFKLVAKRLNYFIYERENANEYGERITIYTNGKYISGDYTYINKELHSAIAKTMEELGIW